MKGHQRYKCKSCGKSFTNTPFRGVGEEKRFLALSQRLCPKLEPSQERVLFMEVDEFWHY